MGIFSKEEKIHFERDEEGNVIRMTRNGHEVQPEPMMKPSKQLEKEYYIKHPEERHPTLRKIGHGAKRVDAAIVKYNRTRNPLMQPQRKFTPRKKTPAHQNFNPFGSTFDTGMPNMPRKKSGGKKYHIVGGKAYPIAGTGKKKKKKRRSSGLGGFNFDSMDNYRFFK